MGLVVALGASGCYGYAADGGVEVTSAPVAVDVGPSVVYEGRPHYYHHNRWYYRDSGRWYYHRHEPSFLYRHRPHWR